MENALPIALLLIFVILAAGVAGIEPFYAADAPLRTLPAGSRDAPMARYARPTSIPAFRSGRMYGLPNRYITPGQAQEAPEEVPEEVEVEVEDADAEEYDADAEEADADAEEAEALFGDQGPFVNSATGFDLDPVSGSITTTADGSEISGTVTIDGTDYEAQDLLYLYDLFLENKV